MSISRDNGPSPGQRERVGVAHLFFHVLADDEPLVRGHAAWALGRIGTPLAVGGLRRRLGVEEDDQVREEIEEAIREIENDYREASN